MPDEPRPLGLAHAAEDSTVTLDNSPTPPPIQLVRLKFGLVGESRRVVHAVRSDHQHAVGKLLTVCGQFFSREEIDVLPELIGLPCEPCLILGPTPSEGGGRHALRAPQL